MTEARPIAERHYTRGNLRDLIEGGLMASGLGLERLQPEDLAPVDEFHTRGRAATLELGERAGLTADMHVLDVGAGIGGPARYLAATFGCRVTALDLTEEFCRVGEWLTGLTGLADRVGFRHGNALAMPFDDGTFDMVWTQHVSMNIQDKPGLLREARRVLTPGGRLVLYEVMAGSDGPLHFPVPWAREAEHSFLATPDEWRAALADAGFVIHSWDDTSELAATWFRKRQAQMQTADRPPLGLHLMLGPDGPTMLGNQSRNILEGRACVAQVVAQPAG